MQNRPRRGRTPHQWFRQAVESGRGVIEVAVVEPCTGGWTTACCEAECPQCLPSPLLGPTRPPSSDRPTHPFHPCPGDFTLPFSDLMPLASGRRATFATLFNPCVPLASPPPPLPSLPQSQRHLPIHRSHRHHNHNHSQKLPSHEPHGRHASPGLRGSCTVGLSWRARGATCSPVEPRGATCSPVEPRVATCSPVETRVLFPFATRPQVRS